MITIDIETIAKRYIVEDLVARRMWGGKHTEMKSLTKGLPDHLLKDHKSMKQVQRAIKHLIQDDWLLAKKSTGEIHVSLNSHKQKEIYEFIRENESL